MRMGKLRTYKLTREYFIEAENQQEAEEIISTAENDLDWLDNEHWEINKPLTVKLVCPNCSSTQITECSTEANGEGYFCRDCEYEDRPTAFQVVTYEKHTVGGS